jgi:lipopolysaccharide biosynthesis regulator YciM
LRIELTTTPSQEKAKIHLKIAEELVENNVSKFESNNSQEATSHLERAIKLNPSELNCCRVSICQAKLFMQKASHFKKIGMNDEAATEGINALNLLIETERKLQGNSSDEAAFLNMMIGQLMRELN